MTVSNLGIDAFLNPNNLLNAQVLFEFFGHVSAQFLAERLIFTRVQRPITRIRLMGDQHRSGTTTGKQARVRNDKGTFTINGNRTALENQDVYKRQVIYARKGYALGRPAPPFGSPERMRSPQ